MPKAGRRMGWIGAVVLIAAFLTAVSVGAQTLSVTADRVNLRAKPSTDSAIVATVERGAELTVIETAGSWYRVRDNASGKEGYVHSLTVKVIGGAPATPAAGGGAAAPPRTPVRTAPAPSAPPPSSAAEEKSTSIVPMAGLITGGGTTTWVIGGGVGFKPFPNPAIRVQADVLYHRFSEEAPAGLGGDLKMTANAFWFSANGHYLFPGDKMTPYVGAGIALGYATIGCSGSACSSLPTGSNNSSTDFGFQGLGGVDYPMGSLTLRGEARLIIIGGETSFAILGGVKF